METRQVIMILGKTGSGKTTLSKSLRQKYSRVLTVDTLHEYDGTIFYDFQSLIDYAGEFRGSNFSITLRPEEELDVEYLFHLAWIMRDVCVVVEEAEQWVSSTSMSEALKKLIAFGRHRNISLIAVGRVVPEIPIQLRRQFTHFYTFRQSEPHDLDLLSLYGFDSSEIQALPDHQYKLLTQ